MTDLDAQKLANSLFIQLDQIEDQAIKLLHWADTRGLDKSGIEKSLKAVTRARESFCHTKIGISLSLTLDLAKSKKEQEASDEV